MIPQTLKKCELKLIMPCYCAGAKQDTPELRAASFRGELRWWFRCLGGSREQENTVFGTVHGTSAASAVALLVSPGKHIPRYDFQHAAQTDRGYISHFLHASDRIGYYLPPEYKFTLELRQRAAIAPATMQLLELAWDCLCNLGAIGYRKTRAFGSFAPVNPAEQKVQELIENPLVNQHFRFKLNTKREYSDIDALLSTCGSILRNYRKDNRLSGEMGSVLGAIGPKYRQSSAVRFRPVLIADKLYLCILQAPDITLGVEAKQHNLPQL